MSRETRTIRPFVGVEALGRAFDRSLLHFGKETCPPGGNQVVEISPQEFLARQVTLSLAPDDESFEMFKEELRMAADEAGLPLEALSLLIVARSAFLGITDTVLNRSLDDLVDLQRRIDLVGSKRSPALRAPFGGFVVEAFLYLERPLEAQPLRPHRRGTWLAKARYGISTSLGPAVLPITPLTEETRARLRLPASRSASLGAATYEGRGARFNVGCDGRLSPEANVSAVVASVGSESPVDEILILDASHPSLRQQCDDPLDIGPISIGVGEQVPR